MEENTMKDDKGTTGEMVRPETAEPEVARSMTYGEKAVGINFNPSQSSGVDKVKELSAKLIDIMDDFRKVEASNMQTGEHKRLASVAITQIQQAQMWAVKALTWRDF